MAKPVVIETKVRSAAVQAPSFTGGGCAVVGGVVAVVGAGAGCCVGTAVGLTGPGRWLGCCSELGRLARARPAPARIASTTTTTLATAMKLRRLRALPRWRSTSGGARTPRSASAPAAAKRSDRSADTVALLE